MKTFTIDGRELAINKQGKLVGKVSFGPAEWGAVAWLPVTAQDLINEEIDEQSLTFENFPKIPFEEMLFVREFFSAVYDEHKSEAFVYFHLDQESGKYTTFVPPTQSASAGHVSFDGLIPKFCTECRVGNLDKDAEECAICGHTELTKAFIVGTAHSHGSMAAYHSSTDDANELDTTGFHITFGKVNSEVSFEIAHSYVVNRPGFQKEGVGVRFKKELSPFDLIERPFVQKRPLIERWVSLVISLPALAKLQKDQNILMSRSGDVISILGTEEQFARMAKMWEAVYGEKSTVVLTKSELDELIKEQKKKESIERTKSSKSGVKQLTGGQYQGTTAKSSGKNSTNRTTGYVSLRKKYEFSESVVKIDQDDTVISVDAQGIVKVEGPSKYAGAKTNFAKVPAFYKAYQGSTNGVLRFGIYQKLVFEIFDRVEQITKTADTTYQDSIFNSVQECLDLITEILGYPSKFVEDEIEEMEDSDKKNPLQVLDDIFDEYELDLLPNIKTDAELEGMVYKGAWLLQEMTIAFATAGALRDNLAEELMNAYSDLAIAAMFHEVKEESEEDKSDETRTLVQKS